MKKLCKIVLVTTLVTFFCSTVQATEKNPSPKSEQPPSTATDSIKPSSDSQTSINNPLNSQIASDKQPSLKQLPELNPSVQQSKLIETEKFKPLRKLPANYKRVTIIGEPRATEKQAVAFIKKNTRDFKLKCTPEEIVQYYYEESAREGIRADMALCQALLETGFFKFGGTVKADQNNFCGLGTTGKTVAGASFRTPQIGVRAHIQHLLAYATDRNPKTHIVDPRYDLVQKMRKASGFLLTWHSLNGNWAASSEYSEKIFDLHSKMLGMPVE